MTAIFMSSRTFYNERLSQGLQNYHLSIYWRMTDIGTIRSLQHVFPFCHSRNHTHMSFPQALSGNLNLSIINIQIPAF